MNEDDERRERYVQYLDDLAVNRYGRKFCQLCSRRKKNIEILAHTQFKMR